MILQSLAVIITPYRYDLYRVIVRNILIKRKYHSKRSYLYGGIILSLYLDVNMSITSLP